MKIKRKIIKIDEALCDGCGACVTSCEEGAIKIIDGKAKVVNEVFCDGLGACIGDCPQGALTLEEREAEAFDEKAVEAHLAKSTGQSSEEKTMACGCPSTNIQTFQPVSPCQAANQPKAFERSESLLTNWPIQINLVPPSAPFLREADLLIAADCVPASYPNFHQDFLKDKVMLLGCPKLDNAQAYIEKFAQILQTANLKSVTVVIMEVPCCSGMPMILKKAMEMANVSVPVEEVIVSIREGKILERARN